MPRLKVVSPARGSARPNPRDASQAAPSLFPPTQRSVCGQDQVTLWPPGRPLRPSSPRAGCSTGEEGSTSLRAGCSIRVGGSTSPRAGCSIREGGAPPEGWVLHRGRGVHLLEGVHDLLALAEVLEEQLQGPRDQRGIVVHGEVDKHAQQHAATLVIHLQHAAGLPEGRGGCDGQGIRRLPATRQTARAPCPPADFAKSHQCEHLWDPRVP